MKQNIPVDRATRLCLLEFYGLGTPETLANLQELVGPSYALLDPSCQRMTASWPAGGYSSISILKS